MTPEDETPHPPATAEFGAVTPGGPTHMYADAAGLQVKKFSVGSFDNNVYVISSNGVALIVDGANDAERILAEVADVTVKAILQTHGHPDHVQALTTLKGALDVPIYAHGRDARLLPVNSEDLGEGDAIRIGDATVRVFHTPGHTPGSLCFVSEPFLFSGDTLFPGGPGNTWGDPNAFAQIIDSVENALFTLDDDTVVYPGHGRDTTIGTERPHLQEWKDRGW
jgi:glyoxylase-like metal-dependent hydrolase (beta-lactamase superfamily II)